MRQPTFMPRIQQRLNSIYEVKNSSVQSHFLKYIKENVEFLEKDKVVSIELT